MSKPLIESCYNLPISAIKLPERGCGESGEVLISNRLTLLSGQNQLEIDYWLEQEEDELSLTLSLATGEPQTIRLTTSYPPLGGERLFFECPECGRRCSKLYLAPDGQVFKCHKHFIYEATTINRQAVNGQFFYRQNRLIKLVNQRTDINRIFYGGAYTKRFCRWLKMCARAGLPHEAESAIALLAEINAVKAV